MNYLLAVAILGGFIGMGSCYGLHPPVETKASGADGPGLVVTTPPLIAATLAGDVENVRSQLQQGTDPNLVHNTNTALTYAARDGFTEIALVLIDHGADVNWIDGEGVTPLILAAFKNHLDLVQLLLAHGADPTVKDQWHRTALDYALRRGEADPIVQLLRPAN
ncbi:ankyrin repeat domain-containing protein [Leptothoe sp. PORK10 BA2]|uniref:ankyrin repeat domain-containing protein n=1 Tax=Leptothoe sp. PORK10 BA2 TaxID=3110254 RepID=UPI002B220318|nr:ankyrin repeat domain-containing protein [Leptothoe sp. PORK10 BA2]MEA5466671.1 ankyrin repeat domain-containing protein [Leptothoe sp. PORK10 BA2]